MGFPLLFLAPTNNNHWSYFVVGICVKGLTRYAYTHCRLLWYNTICAHIDHLFFLMGKVISNPITAIGGKDLELTDQHVPFLKALSGLTGLGSRLQKTSQLLQRDRSNH